MSTSYLLFDLDFDRYFAACSVGGGGGHLDGLAFAGLEGCEFAGLGDLGIFLVADLPLELTGQRVFGLEGSLELDRLVDL